jgi:hypothetical protein
MATTAGIMSWVATAAGGRPSRRAAASSEGVGVVDQRQLAFEEGPRCRVENQEVREGIDHQPDLRTARPFEDDVEHIVQADGTAEGRGDP